MNWKEVEALGLKLLKEYDASSILEDEVFETIFDEEDQIMRARMILSLIDRAKELGVKTKFEEILKAYKRAIRSTEAEERSKKRGEVSLENYTNFSSNGKYENMFCGPWIATDNGVYAQNFMSPNDIVACYHPILPISRLKNMETNEEQIVLAYKRNGHWNEIKVPKDIISSANKIISLSKYGISVTSENAKHLVRYLSDVENMNDDYIDIQTSTSKLGWHSNDFIPYDSDIIFDGDTRFRSLFEAIHEKGSEDIWIEHVSEIRKSGRIEAKFMLAASFASVLVGMLGTLPFFVDLWGETEGGKSVSLMLACSVWANPDESQYIGDFKTTDVALEAKADMLNNLPMILDDTSKTSSRIKDNFEGVVYDLCSGKGKSRSNKELGVNRENRWKNCILTNGERPLQSYVCQGGAINRILEVECGANVYLDPQNTANTLKRNYGFAGKRFIEIIKAIGIDSIKEIYQGFCKQLFAADKMQKQSMSLAVVLTADKIVTEHIFKDKCYISIDEAKETLVDRNMISDNERCYQYLIDKVAMNSVRFDGTTGVEKWGTIDGSFAYFYPQAFEDLCKAEGFSKKSFLSWADRKELILTEGGRTTKQKKIAGKNCRCIVLKLEPVDDDGFLKVEDPQEELPFT